LSARACASFWFEVARFQLGLFSLETGHIGRVHPQGFALWQQKVAGIAVLDGYDLAHLTEFCHAFEKNDIHDMSLLYSVWQQGKEPSTLDRTGESALVLGTDSGDAGWHDLATLGDIALQGACVLIVDLGRIGAFERIGLAAAEEWLVAMIAILY